MYANLYSEPSFKSELITQGVLWEKIEVHKAKDNWLYIEQNDGYHSWINKFYVIKRKDNKYQDMYRIPKNIQKIFSSSNKSSNIIGEAVFGVDLPIINKTEKWIQTILPDQKDAFVLDLTNIVNSFSRDSIVELSKTMIGIPYLWGGKTTIGFDCSGFIQTLFSFYNIILPRDTKDQILFKDFIEIEYSDLQKGDLVYFHEEGTINHVAIYLKNNNIIHCSGQVKIESLDKNKILSSKILNSMSISKLLSE